MASFQSLFVLSSFLFLSTGVFAQQTCEEKFSSLISTVKKAHGNYNFSIGPMRYGPSDILGLREVEKIDLQALVDSWDKMPSDLKTALKEPISAINQMLRNPASYLPWKDQLEKQNSKIVQVIGSVGCARFEKDRSRLETLYGRKLGANDEKIEIRKYTGFVEEEIIEKKYKDHPNWKRAQKTFESAKSDLIVLVKNQSLPPDYKSWALEKLSKTRLILPKPQSYVQMMGLSPTEDCSKDDQNAEMHDDGPVICAGRFNAIQINDGLFSVITHEMSHSFNIKNYCAYLTSKLDEEIKLSTILDENNKKSCEEWSEFKKNIKNAYPNAHEFEKKIPQNVDRWENCLFHHFTKRQQDSVLDWSTLSTDDASSFKEDGEKYLADLGVERLFDPKGYPDLYLQPSQFLRKAYPEYERDFQLEEKRWEYPGLKLKEGNLEVFLASKELECRLKKGAQISNAGDRRFILGEAVKAASNIAAIRTLRLKKMLPSACHLETHEIESDWWASQLLFKKISDQKLEPKRAAELMFVNIPQPSFTGSEPKRGVEKRIDDLKDAIAKIASPAYRFLSGRNYVDYHLSYEQRMEIPMAESVSKLFGCSGVPDKSIADCKLSTGSELPKKAPLSLPADKVF